MIDEKRKEELMKLLYTWRDLTQAGASADLNCEELKYMLEVEQSRPPPRKSVLDRIRKMLEYRCSNET